MGGVRYDISDSNGTQGLEVYLYPDREDVEEVQIEVHTDGQQQYCIFPYTGQCTVDGGNGDYGVCLNHSYHKAIKPFEQDTKYFSWIWEIENSEGNQLFPNGMRSAGSAYDEISFNPTTKKWEAVKRVDSRAFAEGDAEDTTVKTDGATTNYLLAEPIVVELDYPTAETNMDYLVWDFGTEESIASVPSAPFRADINYEPNAVDDLRWAVSEIRNLKAQLAQMSASVTNLTE
jgi:hypothetical protein